MRHLLPGRSRMPSRRAFRTVVRFVRRVRVPPRVRRVRYVPTTLRSWNPSPTTTATSDSDSILYLFATITTDSRHFPGPSLGIFCMRKILEVFYSFFAARRILYLASPSMDRPARHLSPLSKPVPERVTRTR